MKSMSAIAPRSSAAPAHMLLAIAIVLALLGGAVTVGSLLGGDDSESLSQAPAGRAPAINDVVPTSFGVISVLHVDKADGLTARELGGMTHGIQDYVKGTKAAIEVSIALTNTTDSVVPYSPRDYRLLAGNKTIKPVRATIKNGTLQPDASIDAQLQFVVPRNGSNLELAFSDRGDGRTIVIDLGRVNIAPPSAKDEPHHG